MKSEVKDCSLQQINFTRTDLNHPIFTNVIFENCLLDRTVLDDARFYGCDFIDCTFRKVKFEASTIGAHGGAYRNCIFEQCKFGQASFYNPEFVGCLFEQCRWNGADLNASFFENCRFTGKLDDVRFRGRYESDLYPNARPNPMRNVDFSEAQLGKYVDFTDCDLSSAIPPTGRTFAEIRQAAMEGEE
ncbi:pentapeptide repeat-containing protein [Paenibacillus bovis]|uniref:Pentapeptide repeat-containing protein n=1 Tax=Paenibacillus bovis TaxID=1616788 RepID=A0A172ZBI2_9BACL|nr:pentapeptide repeat-containing protein [Paenibacillus bovis]ANF94879.1 hypothetical protein AR543_01750 [Paenibacillus bovis]